MPILLAIIRDDDDDPHAPLSAALYDPAEDRVVRARAGDVLLGRTIRSISTTGIELELRGSVARLALDPDGGPPR